MTASRIKNATRIMNRIARRTRQASQKKTNGFWRILIICKTAPVRHLSNKNGASSAPFFEDTTRGHFDQASPQDSECTPRVWAGPVGPTASAASVRAGSVCDRSCAQDDGSQSAAIDLVTIRFLLPTNSVASFCKIASFCCRGLRCQLNSTAGGQSSPWARSTLVRDKPSERRILRISGKSNCLDLNDLSEFVLQFSSPQESAAPGVWCPRLEAPRPAPLSPLLKTGNGVPRVWAGLVGLVEYAASVRAGLASGRKTARSSFRTGAGDRVQGHQVHCETLFPIEFGRSGQRSVLSD